MSQKKKHLIIPIISLQQKAQLGSLDFPGVRLQVVLPHLLRKLMKLEDPETTKLLPLLEHQLFLAESVSQSLQMKEAKELQVHRTLDKMNVNALLDLIKAHLPETLIRYLAHVQEDMIPSPTHGEQVLLPEGKVVKFWI